MSLIISVGKPVWRVIVDRQPGQFRVVFGWISLIFVDFDLDAKLTAKDQSE